MPLVAELPDWIQQEAWDGFVEMRKRIKKPMTCRAATLIIKQLAKLRERGEDANEVLDQSTMLSWQGVFPIRKDFRQPQQAIDVTQPWLDFRAAIRAGCQPSDPVLANIMMKFGGVGRMGEQSSWAIENQYRKDFEAAYRAAKSH